MTRAIGFIRTKGMTAIENVASLLIAALYLMSCCNKVFKFVAFQFTGILPLFLFFSGFRILLRPLEILSFLGGLAWFVIKL